MSRVRGRARSVGVVSRLVVGVPWWCSHQGSRGSEGVVLAGSAAEACIRAGGAHDGIVGHGQVGLNQFVDCQHVVGVMPIVELAAWSCPSLTLRRLA